MKKIIVLLTLLSIVAALFSSCGAKATARAGLGVYSDLTSDGSAIGGNNGHTTYTHTAAAIILDKEGRITACDIDAAEVRVEYTSSGKPSVKPDYKTKGELGDSYGMSAAGAKLEWYAQRDAFCKTVIGKTIREVKESVTQSGKGSQDIISAGCTIAVDGFVAAIVEAEKNARAVSGEPDSIKLTVKTSAMGREATDSAVGSINAVTEISADVSGVNTLKERAEFSIWFSKTGILQPEPEKSATL